jgi:hypothetical protein
MVKAEFPVGIGGPVKKVGASAELDEELHALDPLGQDLSRDLPLTLAEKIASRIEVPLDPTGLPFFDHKRMMG